MDVRPKINNADQPVVRSSDLGGESEAAPPSVQLTTLQRIAVRDVWPTGPHHFTPWLLANSEQLSKVLGLDVQLEKRRVSGRSVLSGPDRQGTFHRLDGHH
jgi:hypothetical protein